MINLDMKIWMLIGICLISLIIVPAYGESIPDWVKKIFVWYGENKISENEVLNAIKFLIINKIIQIDELPIPVCSGNEGCIPGIVTEIIDGDTIKVYGKDIRFTLVDTPEKGELGYNEAKKFVEASCPIGSSVLVDEDDERTLGTYGRILGVVYCNGLNLNEAVLEEGHAEIIEKYCSKSEFGSESWAKKHGC